MPNNKTILDTTETFPVLRKLCLEDGDNVKNWMQDNQVGVSDLTFTNLFVWNSTKPVYISHYDNFLIILRFDQKDIPLVFSPIGQGDTVEVIEHLLSFLETDYPQKSAVIERVPEDIAKIPGKADYQSKEDRGNFDYVYRVRDLTELEGRKYDGKRNNIKRCLKAYACEYERITPDNRDECLQLHEEWCNIRNCEENPALEEEFLAIRRSFEQFERLGLIGGAIRINGQIEAFAVGEAITEDTAVVHFEKANPKKKGLYQVINQWFCRNEINGFTWVNREQDLGVEGLRKAKMSYNPHHFIKKFTISRT